MVIGALSAVRLRDGGKVAPRGSAADEESQSKKKADA